MSTKDDFTPTGLKLEGQYENDRNIENADLFKAILRECYGITDCIIAHHLTYVKEELRSDGFKYQIVQEIPSADALIFDHDIAKRIWGKGWEAVLTTLALTPVPQRDQVLAEYWNRRNG